MSAWHITTNFSQESQNYISPQITIWYTHHKIYLNIKVFSCNSLMHKILPRLVSIIKKYISILLFYLRMILSCSQLTLQWCKGRWRTLQGWAHPMPYYTQHQQCISSTSHWWSHTEAKKIKNSENTFRHQLTIRNCVIILHFFHRVVFPMTAEKSKSMQFWSENVYLARRILLTQMNEWINK